MAAAKVCTVEFNPDKSAGKAKALLAFLQSAGGLDDVTKVPSIGPKLRETLATKVYPQITTVYQLMGRFLQFRRKNISQEEWCQSMYKFLVENGARTDYAQHITYCLAECLNLYFPGVYDGESFGKCDVSKFVELPTAALPDGSGTGYDVSKSSVTPAVVKALIDNGTTFEYANDLSNVKSMGFGAATLKNLANKDITSVYQFYGCFLGLHKTGIRQEQWTDLCYRWCKTNGCASRYCASITDSMCQLLDVTFGGLYDREAAVDEAAAAAE